MVYCKSCIEAIPWSWLTEQMWTAAMVEIAAAAVVVVAVTVAVVVAVLALVGVEEL